MLLPVLSPVLAETVSGVELSSSRFSLFACAGETNIAPLN